jgi:glucosamine--fructose-6-phosphate aminotransferase (isomerizing)
LKRLEYRGYDSAGLSVFDGGEIHTFKKKGKVHDLEKIIKNFNINTNIGIAHTRWATHGFPNDINAHPHLDNSKRISIVHNGIIENYSLLKKSLLEQGYYFYSETDSEVLAVLIGAIFKKTQNIEDAVRIALNEVTGTFGIVVLSADEPNKLIAARRGSPMVLGIGENEYIFASDASAIIQHTRQVIYLSDDEMAIASNVGYITKTITNEKTNNEIYEIEFDLDRIEKSGYDHFMLKEIFEQPITIQDAYRGRLIVNEGNVKLGGLRAVLD